MPIYLRECLFLLFQFRIKSKENSKLQMNEWNKSIVVHTCEHVYQWRRHSIALTVLNNWLICIPELVLPSHAICCSVLAYVCCFYYSFIEIVLVCSSWHRSFEKLSVLQLAAENLCRRENIVHDGIKQLRFIGHHISTSI